jgi:hypothetical protein
LGAWPIHLTHVLCFLRLLENCCVVGGHLELLGVAWRCLNFVSLLVTSPTDPRV